jgi:DNA-binding MarR family transcriptional regulator
MSTPESPAGEPHWLDEQEQRAWRGLTAMIHLLPAALDRQLRAEADIPHAYYLILAMLSEAPERTLRMSDLARITSTSPSRLSHAVARLQERGWVQRRQCPSDGRGQVAVLTDSGHQTLAGAAAGHVAQVRRLVFDRLSREQVRQLAGIADRVVTGSAVQDPL